MSCYLPETLEKTLQRLENRSAHTHEWYARHYGKLHDWARKVLPEPYRNQFFSCVANGLYDAVLDRGKPYTCNAGFEVTPGGYFRTDTAEGQLILEQTRRAEDAEMRCAALQELLDGLSA